MDVQASGNRRATVRLRGRQVQINMLGGQLDGVRAGRGGAVLVTGLAGMGKSALLGAAESMARERGIRVFHGAGDVAAQVVPFGPLLEALVSTDDPPVDPVVLRDLSQSPDQRFWMLRELEESLERAAMRGPVLISIDDVQWADPATLVALGTLPRQLAAHRILWLFAVRSGELAGAACASLGKLEAAGALRITLDPLDPAAVAAVAEDLLGGVPEPGLLEVLAGAQGQPFLLTELLRGLLDEQLIKVDGGTARLAGSQLPVRFLDSVGRQLARLSVSARDTLQLASVLGRRFSADELAALTGVSPTTVLDALREALATGLVIEDGDRIAFRHELVREAVEASLPTTIRQSMRRRAVDVRLEYGAPPSDVAELVMEVARPGDAKAITILRRAAEEIGRVSPMVAGLLSRRALDLTPSGDPGRGQLTVETIGYLVYAGQAAEAVRLITAAAGDLANPATEAEALLTVAILSMQYASSDVVQLSRRALDLPGVSAATRIQSLAVLSLGLDLVGDVNAAEKAVMEAASRARASGNPASEVVTLIPQAAHALAWGDAQQAIDLASDAVDRWHAAEGIAARLWLPNAWKALILIVVAHLEEAFALIDSGMKAAQQDGTSANIRIWSMLRCRALFSAGRLADARAEAEAIIEMADGLADGTYGYVSHVGLYVLGRVALHTGDPDGLAQARRSAARFGQDETCPATQRLGAWLMTLLAAADGDPTLAIQSGSRQVDPLADGPLPATSPRTYADSVTLTGIFLAAGRRADAESVVAHLEDFAARHPDFPSLDCSALHARALLDSDAETALQAVARSRVDPRPLVRAAVLEDAGQLLPDARTAEAVPLLEQALASYAAAGAERDAARVRSLLRIRGVRPPAGGPRSAPEWPELTESEFAVVSLVARGATNREVAERLYLSPYTVNSHLRHVFAKLGIRSRVELARLAAEHETPAEHK